MNDDYLNSRGISIELNSKKLWNKEFIKLILSLLDSMSSYSVYVDHDLLDYPDFSLFLIAEKVMAFSEKKRH